MEKIVDTLSDHGSRIKSLEDYQTQQNHTIDKVDKKIDWLIRGIGAGMFTIIIMLVKILWGG